MKSNKEQTNIIDKKSNKKGLDITKDIVVNFKYDDYEPFESKYKSKYRKNYSNIFFENVDILNQSRFRFILNLDDDCYKNKENNNNTELEWDKILAIVYYSVDIYTCSICLEQKLVCPMITRCGHIFCWPCIYNYNDYCTKISINKKIPKCPLCKELIHLNQIKFCEILNCLNYSDNANLGNEYSTKYVTFNLIMKDKTSPTLYNLFYDPDLEYYKSKYKENELNQMLFNFIPFDRQEEFGFSRVFQTKPNLLLNRYLNIREELNETLKLELSGYNDLRNIESINKCSEIINNKIKDLKLQIDSLDNKKQINNQLLSKRENEEKQKDKNNIREKLKEIMNKQDLLKLNKDSTNKITEDEIIENIGKEEEAEVNKRTGIDLNKYMFFYQEQFGDIYFLHPINQSILLAEYSSEERLPIEISVN